MRIKKCGIIQGCHKKKGDKTGMTWACGAVVQWDVCYIFKLTFVAHVNFTPHQPYNYYHHSYSGHEF